MKYLSKLATLVLALTFAACSQEAVEEPVPEAEGNVHITLSAPFNAPESRAPQSAGYTADVDKTRELIESYYVVFTQDKSGTETIVKVVEKADAKVGANGKESERLDIELRSGTYKVYAFANIPFSYLNGTDKAASKPGYNLTVDAAMPDLSAATFLIPDGVMKSGKSFKDKCFVPCEDVEMVPMTSINGQTITVTERTSQTFGIEVVRMLGKVQFDFRNPTSTALQINSIKMSDLTVNNSNSVPPDPIRDGATMLMNYNDLYSGHSGTNSFLDAPINRPAGFNTAQLDADYTSSPLALAKHVDTPSPKDGTATASFYVLESQARAALDNSFELDFDITPTTGGPYTDKIRYAITKPDNFTTIHRNDWIVIPVTIGEWVMSLTAFSYPPIGGYPSARVSADKSGNFHVTFATPGDISFYPVIHKYYSTTDNFYLNDPDRIVKRASSDVLDPSNPKDKPFMGLATGKPYISLTVDPAWDAPTSILSTEPAIDPFTGSIETILNSKTGKTTLTLAVRFYKTLPTGGETAEQLKAMQETLISKIVIERI